MTSKRSETQTGGREATNAVIPGRFALSVGKPDIATPQGWSWTRLTDVARLETGHTPSRKHPEYWDGVIPWVGIKDATSNHGTVIKDTYQHATQLGIDNSSARVLPANTVCLSRTASVGYVVTMGQPMATSQDFVNWVCSSSLDYRYLASILVAESSSYALFSRGTTHQTIYFPEVKAFHALLPPIQMQRRIADVIWSINDKIQLNHRINQTLEQMAQALFKSWFVDFEPVKAKIAALEAGGSDEDALLAAMEAVSGKAADQLVALSAEQPTHYAELRATAELFPSAMQDSELGEIPEGWCCLPLDTIAKYQNGLALQKYRPENENDYLPVVKIAQLKKGFADGEEKASPNIKPDCIIDDGDVVFSWSGSLMVDTWCGGKAAMNQHLFKVTSTDYPKWLYYYLTKHHLEEFQRIAESKAVTMGHIKRQHLREALCAIPDEQLLDATGQHLGHLLNKQIIVRLETKTLSKLHDTLLPKLLSGELTLPDVDETQTESQDVAHV